MKTSESIKALAPALIEALKHINNVAPNKQGYGYKYADLALIIDSSKPALLAQGIVVLQFVGKSEKSIQITTTLLHTSGEWIEDGFDLPETAMKNANNVQQMGASITYGRRYGLAAILGIAVDEDTDGVEKTTDKADKKPSAQTKEPTKKEETLPGVEPIDYGNLILTLRSSTLPDAEKAELENKFMKLGERNKPAYAKFISERIAQ